MEPQITINIIEEPQRTDVRRSLPAFDRINASSAHNPSDDLRILIAPAALQRAIAHTRTTGTRQIEVGGILVGYPVDEPAPHGNGVARYVVVVDMIPALGAREGRTTIQFTPQSWETIYREVDGRYEGLQIVGWYHSHPGYTVFFSEVDLRTQKNYFRQPYHIALVIDPLEPNPTHPSEADYGFFRWRHGNFQSSEPCLEYGRLRP